MNIEEATAAQLGVCVFPDCGKIMLSETRWRRVTPEEKAILLAAGFDKHNGRGLCRKCYGKLEYAGGLEDFAPVGGRNASMKGSLDQNYDLPALYAKYADDEYPTKRIAEEIGAHVVHVQKILRKLGIKYKRGPSGPTGARRKRDAMIEEVEFLLSCGCGVAEIAQKVGLAPDELITRTDGWRDKGLTKADLRYRDREDGQSHKYTYSN